MSDLVGDPADRFSKKKREKKRLITRGATGVGLVVNIYLVQKETHCFHLHFFRLKIIDFKNCFNSVICLPIKTLIA